MGFHALATRRRRRRRRLHLALSSFLLLIHAAVAPGAGGVLDTLEQGRNITDAGGDTLVSADGSFTLGFFSPGASAKRYLGIWYTVSSAAVCWVANRGRPLNGTSGVLVLSNSGSLLLLDGGAGGQPVWTSNSAGAAAGPVAAQLLDSGNLRIHGSQSGGGGDIPWQSFDYPTDTLLPDMKLGRDTWSNSEWYLASWRSADDPSPACRFVMEVSHGLPDVFLWDAGGNKVYRTGPWNGVHFSGVTEAATSYNNMFTFHMTINGGEVTFGYSANAGAPPSRIVATDACEVRRRVWEAAGWVTFFKGPRDICDEYAKCGAFGVCDGGAASSSFCSCVKGFTPVSPSAWRLRETSGGCRRSVALDCGGGGEGNGSTTDGFLLLQGVKLPDTYNASVDMAISPEECGARCLADCSCVAFAPANINGGGAGTGCVIWTDQLIDLRYVDGGQDLYLRLPKSELGEMPHRPFPTAMVAGVAVASLAAMLFVVFLVVLEIRRRQPAWRRHTPITAAADGGRAHSRRSSPEVDSTPCSSTIGCIAAVSLSDVLVATENFSNSKIIGHGGFGYVYEGVLSDRKAAVKRLIQSRLTPKGKKDFIREVEVMSRLRNPNLVELFCYCQEGEEWILVYEYMEKKSLDLYIFGEDAGVRSSLNWTQRLKVIRGVAEGLAYLHEERVIHRDIKAGNILLDGTWQPKIADFNTAKLFIDDETDPTLVLTWGYIAPEYAFHKILSLKCDVYSFGVVLLEIFHGKRNSSVPTFLLDVWESWNRRELEDLFDSNVLLPEPELWVELERFIHIGLLCVQPSPEARPAMPDVVEMMKPGSGWRLDNPTRPMVITAADRPGPSFHGRG